jgi:hypothetical protein
MRFDLIGLQFEVRTEDGETQQGAEKPAKSILAFYTELNIPRLSSQKD